MADGNVERGVIEVEVGRDHLDQAFGAVNSSFERFNVGGYRVAATVRGLIVCAIWHNKSALTRDKGAVPLDSRKTEVATHHNCKPCNECRAASHRTLSSSFGIHRKLE